MEYQDNLIRYNQLKDSLPNNRLIQVCVTRYEVNLIMFNLTKENKYEIILKALGKIIETFINIEIHT
jgi:hypothetical protein